MTTSRQPAPKPAPRHLDPVELEALLRGFADWVDEAARPADRFARCRLLFIVKLLRHTGAKLGEVLALDERTDFDLTRRVVVLGKGEAAREVRIPDDLADELAALLTAPEAAAYAGRLFRLDQGHVRRKFAERAEAAGLPRELANPSALRRSRAVELSRDGLPLTAVQSILGHSTASLTASFVDFTPEEVTRLTETFLRRDGRRRTSARNSFYGKVVRLESGDVQCEVELLTLGGHRVVSVITEGSRRALGLSLSSVVTAEVKAPWVILARPEEAGRTSARNRFAGVVEEAVHGKVVSEITVRLDDGTQLCALVTRGSARELRLAPGEPVVALCKAFSVILHAD